VALVVVRDIITSSAEDSVCTLLCTIENNINSAPLASLEFLAEKGYDVPVMISSVNTRREAAVVVFSGALQSHGVLGVVSVADLSSKMPIDPRR